MKLLVLYNPRDAAQGQPGYSDGFCRLTAQGVLEAHRAIPFLGTPEEKGWDDLWENAYEVARDMKADAIFLRFFHGTIPDPTAGIKRLMGLANRPTVFTSLGDPYGKWTHRIPSCFRRASSLSAVTFVTGTGYLAEQLVGWGSRNVVLMPHGCYQLFVRNELDRAKYAPDFDAVFVGSRMGARNPFGHCFRVDSKRAEFVRAFTKRYGLRFGLFGNKWHGNACWQGPIPWSEQYVAMRRGRVVVGGLPGAYYDYYASDREFIALASGIPFVNYKERGVDRYFRNGHDWWLADTIEGMIKATDHLLEKSDSERLDIGSNARKQVLASHTIYHRCREIIRIVQQVRTARLAGERAALPHLNCLSEPVASMDSPPPAIVGWVG